MKDTFEAIITVQLACVVIALLMIAGAIRDLA